MSETVAHAAPLMPRVGIAVNTQLRTTLVVAAIIMLITGIVVLPSPCRMPVLTWCSPSMKIAVLIV
ncbi:hypothetical protein SDC9_113839 [bioreactor metagenome]|uniref:Uncharacterized protein n=1 Tax=bioreactor metagenome TaxID=1076179 RepID=A0A645BNT8_9ZZZZ